ncbi:MAG: 3-oxoacyl-[acyl-carrier-protein] reductase [Candidatus Sumerlaeota bacterium]|nr:3-oxoacyl-[acyl-carrier-protein] reductase [Candidatus Sumerlaeota bacterium]
MLLQDRIAVVTGSGQGIGRAIALKLASEGAHVMISDVMRETGEATAKDVEALGRKSVFVPCDVANSEEAKNLIEETVKAFGRVDILVNNAGITRDGLAMRMSDADWDLVLAINLKGPFNCSRAAMRPMMKQRSGRIINIASVVGVIGNAGQANYSASKGGLISLTKTLARELASRQITVNAVAPGFIRTRMTDVLDEKVKEALMAQIPLGRLGEADDVANAVLFLASDLAAYLTGQVIHVNGGMAMP